MDSISWQLAVAELACPTLRAYDVSVEVCRSRDGQLLCTASGSQPRQLLQSARRRPGFHRTPAADAPAAPAPGSVRLQLSLSQADLEGVSLPVCRQKAVAFGFPSALWQLLFSSWIWPWKRVGGYTRLEYTCHVDSTQLRIRFFQWKYEVFFTAV